MGDKLTWDNLRFDGLEVYGIEQVSPNKFTKSCKVKCIFSRSYIVKTWLQLNQNLKRKVIFTLVVTWFPDLEFTRWSYSKRHIELLLFHDSSNSSSSSGSETVPLMNVQNCDSVTHLIGLLWYPLLTC